MPDASHLDAMPLLAALALALRRRRVPRDREVLALVVVAAPGIQDGLGYSTLRRASALLSGMQHSKTLLGGGMP